MDRVHLPEVYKFKNEEICCFCHKFSDDTVLVLPTSIKGVEPDSNNQPSDGFEPWSLD